MIIDVHVHLGFDFAFDYDFPENDLISGMEEYGVDLSIVQPSVPRPYIEDYREYHNRIYKLCKEHPGRIYGMASINPHFRAEEYDAELERCIYDLGFVGAKLSPIGHAAHPATSDSMHVYEMCAKLDIPVMIHTGEGLPLADPITCVPGIKAFPQVKFILAHTGSDLLFEQALYIAKEYRNVYLDTSWLNVLNTRTIIDTLGASRVMFSSDVPENIPVEIAKYKVAARKAEDYEMALCGTAKAVFKL